MITKLSSVLGRCLPCVRQALRGAEGARSLLTRRAVHSLTGPQSRPDPPALTRGCSVDRRPGRRVPRLVLVQSPFRWLRVKWDLLVLRGLWDPDFNEEDFQRGTKQAICKVTQLLSAGEYSALAGLLTPPARARLTRELDRGWSRRQRALLGLRPPDVQVSSPRKVHFIKIADKKFCDVDVALLALKWVPAAAADALVFAEIFARFHRDYSPRAAPEWTIAYLKFVRFQVLRRSARPD